MTNMSETYWEVNGTSLQTMRWNIETLGGLSTPPPLRGEDELIPHRVGERWLPKVASSRIISLPMWVVGQNADGTIDRPSKDIFDDNIRELRNLFLPHGEQFELTKRFKVNGVLRTAVAKGEYAGGLEDVRMGRIGAKVIVKVKLANPYFYDVSVVTTNLIDGNQDVTVLGDAWTDLIFVTINGDRTIPKIRNNSLAIDFTYNGTLLTGTRLEVSVDNYTAFYIPATGPSQRMTASMLHTGSPIWLYLRPGVNQINVSSSTGTGTVVMTHKAAWL